MLREVKQQWLAVSRGLYPVAANVCAYYGQQSGESNNIVDLVFRPQDINMYSLLCCIA